MSYILSEQSLHVILKPGLHVNMVKYGMNVADLWTAWPVAGPWHLSPMTGGTNNLVWHAEAADGQSYVLRLSFDMNLIPRIRYEAALLQALNDKRLPFLLPLPLRLPAEKLLFSLSTRQGHYCVHGNC